MRSSLQFTCIAGMALDGISTMDSDRRRRPSAMNTGRLCGGLWQNASPAPLACSTENDWLDSKICSRLLWYSAVCAAASRSMVVDVVAHGRADLKIGKPIVVFDSIDVVNDLGCLQVSTERLRNHETVLKNSPIRSGHWMSWHVDPAVSLGGIPRFHGGEVSSKVWQ